MEEQPRLKQLCLNLRAAFAANLAQSSRMRRSRELRSSRSLVYALDLSDKQHY